VVSQTTERQPAFTVQTAVRAMSALMERWKLGMIAGLQFGGKRELYKVFGYDQHPKPKDFLIRYMRQDIAARIIDAPPDATWAQPPEFMSGSRNQKWLADNSKKLKLWVTMHRVDRLARLGRYAILVMGLKDGGRLDTPAGAASELVYLRAFGERQADIEKFDENPNSPRYGKPEMYKVTLDDIEQTKRVGGRVLNNEILIHHSRVIHVTENPLEDEVFSIPIIQKVYNLLDDLLKVVGGTAETYWLVANRGLHVDIDKEMELDPADAVELKDMVEQYQHQLARILRTRGVKVNQLGSETPNPKEVFDMLMALLSGTTGIPRRILLGAEAGQLASEQDRANWAERIMDRRVLFAEPYILWPFVERLMDLGIMNRTEYEFKWPEAFRVSPLERAQTMAAQARAVGNLSRQTGNRAPMQLTSVEEAREIIGLEGPLPEAAKELNEGDLAQGQLDIQKKAAEDAARQREEDSNENPVEPSPNQAE
jgi:hypothetical protein